MIITSVLTLALDTNIYFRYSPGSDSINMTAYELAPNRKVYLMEETEPLEIMYYIEMTISSLFLFNLITRFIVCPNKVSFVKSLMNWIDFAVVLSQWATVGK